MSYRFTPLQLEKKLIVRKSIGFLGLIVLILAVQSAWAATWWTVTNSNDSGAGSLRDVIAAAAPGDIIVFAPSVTSVTLTAGPITITKTNLTILPDHFITINGNNKQIFVWHNNGSVNSGLVFSNLILAGGETSTLIGYSTYIGGGAFLSTIYSGTTTVNDITNTFWDSNKAIANYTGNSGYNAAVVGGALAAQDSGYAKALIGNITNSTWQNNEASSVVNSLASSSATVYGGAVSSWGWNGYYASVGNISDSHWYGNRATANTTSTNGFASAATFGGALSSLGADYSSIGTINNTDWRDNISHAIANTSSNISGTYALAATSDAYGGALSSSGGYWANGGNHSGNSSTILNLTKTTWSNNLAEAEAYINSSTVGNGTFFSNTHAYGGAFSSISTQSSFGDILDSSWQNNKATAISIDSSIGSFNSSPSAYAYGGALSSYTKPGNANGATMGNIRGFSFWQYNEATATAIGDTNTATGIATAQAYGGALSLYGPSGTTILDIGNADLSSLKITDQIWSNNKAVATVSSDGYLATASTPFPVTINGFAYGGAFSSFGSLSSIGNIHGATWQNNNVAASVSGGDTDSIALEQAIAAGGAFSSWASSNQSFIGDIVTTSWSDNKATASFVGYNAVTTLSNNYPYNPYDYAYVYGGALSSRGSNASTIGNISGSTWTDNVATATGNTQAGTQYHVSYAYAYGGALSSNTASPGNADSTSTIGAISGSTWQNNQVAASSSYSGNVYSTYGFIASAQAYAYGGALSSYSIPGNANAQSSIGSISSSIWSGNSAAATANSINNPAYAYAYGGALSSQLMYVSGVSLYDRSSLIGAVTNSQWENNSAQATATSPHAYAYTYGGALSSSAKQGTSVGNGSSFGSITGGTWAGNSVTAISQVTATTVGTDSHSYAYGGAIYSTALGDPLVIRDSSFTVNTATASGTAGLTDAGGGAIFIDTTSITKSAASTITIEASSANTTLFQGNNVVVNSVTTPNCITFGRSLGDKSLGNAVLNISPDAGGTVALYDPVSVDINNNHSFTLIVNEPGSFIWGGVNQLDVAPIDSFGRESHLVVTNTVNLNAGRIVLLPDFTLKSTTNNLAVNLIGGASGITLVPKLTGRSQSLALFDSPSSFTVTGGQVVIAPVYTGPYFSGSQSWLLTNASGTVTPADFTTANNPSFATSVTQTDTNLYIVLGNLAIPTPTVDPPPADPPADSPIVDPPPVAPPSVLAGLSQNSSANVRAAFNSGALDAAWNTQQAVLDPALYGAALNVLNTHPQLFTGEAFINQGFAALNSTGNLADRAWQLSRQSPLPFGSRIDPSNTISIRPWAGYTWSSFTQDSTAGHFGFNSAMNGGLGGFSADIGPRATLSFYGASAGGNTSAPVLQSGTNSNATQGGALASYAILPQLQIGLESGYTKITNDGARSTPFGNYTSSYDQTVAIQGASIGLDIPFGINTQLSIIPRVRHLHLDQDAINENGANPTWALHTGSPSAEALISTVATTLSHDFIFGNGMSVTTTLNTEYKHQSGDATLETTASLGSNGSVSSLSSVPQDRDAVKVGASVTSVLYSFYGGINIIAELEYSATNSNNATDTVYHAGINVEF